MGAYEDGREACAAGLPRVPPAPPADRAVGADDRWTEQAREFLRGWDAANLDSTADEVQTVLRRFRRL